MLLSLRRQVTRDFAGAPAAGGLGLAAGSSAFGSDGPASGGAAAAAPTAGVVGLAIALEMAAVEMGPTAAAARFHQLRAMIGIMLVRGAECRKFYGSLAMEGEPVSLEECNPVTILGWLFIAIMLWKAVQ